MKKGFTLVELLIVVAILGILAAVGIVSFGGFLGSAKENATRSNFNSVVKYVETELLKCNIGTETEAYLKYLEDPSKYHALSRGDCSNSFENISQTIPTIQSMSGMTLPRRSHPNPMGNCSKGIINLFFTRSRILKKVSVLFFVKPTDD